MHPNELIHESSPYLLGHAYNPVLWQPWGTKALSQAKQENKLILISIGYSACHWCHVMEKECFEDAEVANLMNQFFVCIKVDREERPDIDQIYLEAVQIMTGQGGWPLNCFTLPNQKPIYGGTYFQKNDWKNILFNLANYWKNKPQEASDYAHQLAQALQESKTPVSSDLPQNRELFFFDLAKLAETWLPYLDHENGGFLGAPKFPLPGNWSFLLGLSCILKSIDEEILSQKILDSVQTTLHKMAFGGIFDQLGGGFARYSTDAYWFLPHFEKMLYDNAQLISLYSSAYTFNKNPTYKKVVRDIIKFVNRDLYFNEGAYFSALDADSEGVEGKYYVWKQSELKTLLGSFEPVFSLYYHIEPNGNWEENNILYRKEIHPPLHEKLGLSEKEFEEEIERCKRTLLTHRYTRIGPGLDDKILVSWNSLLLKGLCASYAAFGDSEYLGMATQTASFIINHLVKGGEVFRSYKNEEAKINGFLEDYAFLADAFLSMYQVTFEEIWVYRAEDLIQQIFLKFQADSSPLFYFTSQTSTPLIARKIDIQDSVIPSSNAILARALFKLGHYLLNDVYAQRAINMLKEVQSKIFTNGPSYYEWANLALEINDTYEICIIGPKAEPFRKEIEKYYIPYKALSGKTIPALNVGNHLNYIPQISSEGYLPVIFEKLPITKESTQGHTYIYICKNKVCELPFTSVQSAVQSLRLPEN